MMGETKTNKSKMVLIGIVGLLLAAASAKLVLMIKEKRDNSKKVDEDYYG